MFIVAFMKENNVIKTNNCLLESILCHNVIKFVRYTLFQLVRNDTFTLFGLFPNLCFHFLAKLYTYACFSLNWPLKQLFQIIADLSVKTKVF